MSYIEEAKILTIQYLQRSPERMERMGSIRLYLQRYGSSSLKLRVKNIDWPSEFLTYTNLLYSLLLPSAAILQIL